MIGEESSGRIAQIEQTHTVPTPIMPQNLLNKLTWVVILDLIARLYTRGDKQHPPPNFSVCFPRKPLPIAEKRHSSRSECESWNYSPTVTSGASHLAAKARFVQPRCPAKFQHFAIDQRNGC